MGVINAEGVDVASALGNLSSALDVVAAVGKHVETRHKELEQWEQRLKARENEVLKREEDLKAREAEWKLKQVAQSEKETTEEQQGNTALKDCKFSSKILLNVGGKLFATTKSTLLQYRGSYFETLLTSCTDKQEYFIDRDAKYFEIVLNYMREGRLRSGCSFATSEWDDIRLEFTFYKITLPPYEPLTRPSNTQSSEDGPSFPVPRTLSILPLRLPSAARLRSSSQPPSSTSSSSIPSFDNNGLLSSSLQEVMRKWLPNQNFVLLHKASVNGFKCSDFHKRCDNKGSTLTIIQSKEGYLFGGYSPESWENPSKNTYKSNPFSFIFTLTNPHGIPPTKYTLKPGDQHAIFCSSATCLAYGGGHDIVVHANSHQNKYSYTLFPSSYVDTTGKGKETFTGSLCFTTCDFEVYYVS